ncbi:MAG: tyrosine-protein phosphatase [Cellvibrionaceae bacterium]
MLDLHCHLLPKIDDGPKDMAAALDLARQAVADGVTHSVVTPHIHHGRWENSIAGISAAVDEFRLALADASIPLTIDFAGEVRIGPEILSMLPNGEIPFLGEWDGKRVMLLEMPHSHILPGTEKIVAWLLKHDVLPMIAHPERNKDVMRKLEKLDQLIELGCLFQVTAGSVAGQFGDLAQERAIQLLERGAVTILASDAHHVDRRPVNLSAGRDAAAEVVGDVEALRLVEGNPRLIIGQTRDDEMMR